MSSLFNDDIGDLDALMQQFNSMNSNRRQEPIAAVPPTPSVLAVTTSLTSGGVAGPLPRTGRRGSMVPTNSDNADDNSLLQPAVTPATFGVSTSRRAAPSAVSWLDEEVIPGRSDEEPVVAAQPLLRNEPAQQDLELDWLSPNTGVKVEVGTVAESTVPHTAGNPPNSVPVSTTVTQHDAEDEGQLLRREELKLLAELEVINDELASIERKISTEECLGEADIMQLEAQVLIKRQVLVDESDKCKEKISRDAHFFSEHLANELRNQQQNMMDEFNTIQLASVRSKCLRNVQTMQDNIRDVKRNIAQCEAQLDLLLTGESRFSLEGVAAALSVDITEVGDKDYKTALLDIAASIVGEWGASRLEVIRTRVMDFIRRESIDAAHHVWEGHRTLFSNCSRDRRQHFLTFLQESVQRFSEFMGNRQAKRDADVAGFRTAVAAMTQRLKEQAAERSSARRQEVLTIHEEHTSQFTRELSHGLQFVQEKYDCLSKADESINEQQTSDLSQRMQLALRVQSKLLDTEEESLRHRQSALNDSVKALASGSRVVSDEVLSSVLSPLFEVHTTLRNLESDLSLLGEEVCAKTVAARNIVVGGDQQRNSSISTEENRLRSLLNEKQHVVDELRREVSLQWDSLELSRARCHELRARLISGFEDQSAVIHEQRLIQASSSATIDMLRSSWESEHRAMLSQSPSTCAIQQLTEVGQAILEKVLDFNRRHDACQRSRAIHKTLSEKDEEQRTLASKRLEDSWVSLHEHWMTFQSRLEATQLRQMQIDIEKAKLEFEKLTLDAMRREFSLKAVAMQSRASAVAQDSSAAVSAKATAANSLHRAEEEQRRIIQEQNRLSRLQSELLEKQNEELVLRHSSTASVYKNSESPVPEAGLVESPVGAARSQLTRRRVSPFADMIELISR